jgi:hypothetical protein
MTAATSVSVDYRCSWGRRQNKNCRSCGLSMTLICSRQERKMRFRPTIVPESWLCTCLSVFGFNPPDANRKDPVAPIPNSSASPIQINVLARLCRLIVNDQPLGAVLLVSYVVLSFSLTPGLFSYDRIIGAPIIQQSTGRGGAGNIRSPSREPLTGRGPEDHSDTRGRDPIPSTDPYLVCDLLLLFSVK